MEFSGKWEEREHAGEKGFGVLWRFSEEIWDGVGDWMAEWDMVAVKIGFIFVNGIVMIEKEERGRILFY